MSTGHLHVNGFESNKNTNKKDTVATATVSFLAPPVGLEPTTCGLTVRRSTDWAKGAKCWHYLFSQAVARQVSSAYMSLTSVFGMGTGGPSWQSIPTSFDGNQPIFYVKILTDSNSKKIITPTVYTVNGFLMVTHTGFEPMLTAWEAAVLTTWPMGHWCTFRDSNPGPTD